MINPKSSLVIGICLVFSVWVLGFGAGGAEVVGKRAVLIVPSHNYQEDEYLIPRQILEEGGVKIEVASSSLNAAEGMRGGMIHPDLKISDIETEDFDAIIFVGGIGAEEYYKDEEALQLAREAYQQKKVLAAICIAPAILARAGVLKGSKATCSWYSISELRKGRAKYTGRPVEITGKIITASGPGAAEAFGRAILKALSE